MIEKTKKSLSEEGRKMLNDAVMYTALCIISESVGVTPEEYLFRFEEVLDRDPQALISIFESG